MPTPVSIARQCLADEAAATLDDAVAVAKRRCHGQTTSLHAISALIAQPSSILREACARARSSEYSPRLQFRALDLCVGVALDRVSAGKSTAQDPPVSNSLMAAIKRSQANQRRHPDTFHLYQQQLNSNPSSQSSIYAVKVEMKHFVMSILDDPIVSRVLGDAGLRTNDIKLALVNPLTTSRFSAVSRSQPLFSCGLSDLELNAHIPKFPFKVSAQGVDANTKRIGEVLLRRSQRNPLLVGVCAEEAFANFRASLNRAESGVLPAEIDGLSLVSIDHDISKFINKDLSEELMGLKFEEVSGISKKCPGPGILVNCGDFKAFMDSKSMDSVIYLVSQLKRLLNISQGKLWFIAFLTGDGDYKKLSELFPSMEMDLDLLPLPITSSTTSVVGKYFKSSLMGSFVPFGGFFSLPSEQEIPICNAPQSTTLCNTCNENFKHEVSNLKGISTDSIADSSSKTLSPWFRMTECMPSKKSDTVEARDDRNLGFRHTALRRKLIDFCQKHHHTQTTKEDISEAKLETCVPSVHSNLIPKNDFQAGSLSTGSKTINISLSSDMTDHSVRKMDSLKPVVQRTDELHVRQMSLSSICTLSSPVHSVTTDLGLGTIYASEKEGSGKPNLLEYGSGMDSLARLSKPHRRICDQAHLPSLHSYQLDKQMHSKDLEYPWKNLAEKVSWQIEAIRTIAHTLSCCKEADERHHSSKKGNHWLSFLGPDRVGKRKVAVTLAEIFFGGQDNLLCIDMSHCDTNNISNSVFSEYDYVTQNMKSERKTTVDFLAEELRKRTHSVFLLENIEKADLLVQNSLSHAVKSGKFRDSHGRDTSINNILFVITSKSQNGGEVLDEHEFSEEKILAARNWEMEIIVGSVDRDFNDNIRTKVFVTPINGKSNLCHSSKRKVSNHDSTQSPSKRLYQFSRTDIDLNQPVEFIEENIDEDNSESLKLHFWPEELLESVDENVIFSPVDFSSLACDILKAITVGIQRVVGVDILLEIDRKVMIQILAAAWLTDHKNALDEWIEQVLCSSVKEAMLRCNDSSNFVFKLVACDGLIVKEHAYRVRLPARITVN